MFETGMFPGCECIFPLVDLFCVLTTPRLLFAGNVVQAQRGPETIQFLL